MNKSFKLNNNEHIPSIGFGTWQIPDGELSIESVKNAINIGYTHIDGAAVYNNERGVGKAIRESGIARENIFVTSKVWNPNRGYDRTLQAFAKTLSDLQVDYLDLYLIHWPASSSQFENWKQINSDTWRAMEELHKAGKIKSLGLSNFLPHHIQPIIDSAHILPAVNQIEYHPGYMQAECLEFCKENDILVEAWAPLGTGKMLSNETLLGIASKYKKSVAQLCIRWVLQNGLLPLPKSQTPSRIRENLEVFDFEISAVDMSTINSMEYFGGSGLHPDEINF